MATPLYDAVKKYIENTKVRTHTPGHSGKADILGCFKDMLPFDVTEVEGLDSLYHADSVIAKAEKLASEFFGTKATLFSAGGCTLAIQTMLALTLKEGDTLLCSRNAHTSVQNCCGLLGADMQFVYPDDDMRISPKAVKAALEQNNKIKAVMITSPNYYGIISDIKSISDVCKEKDVPLLVDNAHGTHLKFFGLHPIQQGADISVCSAHKTLPVLTGGAYLNIANEKYVRYAKQKMSLFGSTSPSYPIMISLDICREYCEDKAKADFLQLQQKVRRLKDVAIGQGIRVLDDNCDPVRLTLDMGTLGEKTAQILRKHGIECEMWDQRFVVMILTPFHTDEQLKTIENAIKCCPRTTDAPHRKGLHKTAFAMSVRKAMFSESECVDVKKAVGRVAAVCVTLCPPGIPVTIPGEIISSETVDILKNSGTFKINVIK